MENINLIKDSSGNPAYLLLSYNFIKKYFPQNFSYQDIEEYFEDYAMNNAMNEAKKTDLMSLDEAIKFLEG